MKNLYTIFLVCFSLNIYGQTYYKFLNNSKWYVHGGSFLQWYETFNTVGDTIVNSISYKKIIQNSSNNIFLVREDTILKKIWAIYYNFDTVEILIYDFSLTINDQITLQSTPLYPVSGGSVTFQVYQIDSILTNDGYKKNIHLANIDTSGYPYQDSWIESVGSAKHPFWFSYGDNYDATYTLICNCQNSSIIYDDGSGSCILCEYSCDNNPIANFTTDTNIIYLGDTIYFNDSSKTFASSYLTNWYWDFGDGTADTVQNPFHIYNQSDTFNVRLIVSNNTGCVDTVVKNIIVKDTVTGLDEIFNKLVADFIIFPNPFNKETIISLNISSLNMGDLVLSLYNILGRKQKILYTVNSENNRIKIKLQRGNLSSGIYFYTILTNENVISKDKLIIK